MGRIEIWAVHRGRSDPGVLDLLPSATSKEFRRLLRRCGMIQSVSRKGEGWDNAVAKRFFRSLKCEQTNEPIYKTRDELRKDVFD